MIYPVGSVYFTAISDLNPSSLFGGTWELLGNRLTVSDNDLNVVGNGKALALCDDRQARSLYYNHEQSYKLGTSDSIGSAVGSTGTFSGMQSGQIGVATASYLGGNLDNSGLIALNNGIAIYSWKRIA